MRQEIRSLLKTPGFTAATILTLALGIGATTAIFSVADAVLLRPLPYPNSDRLIMVRDELSTLGVHYTDVSYDTAEPYRKNPAFEASAVFTQDDRNLVGARSAERISVISTTPELPGMLGAGTTIGRTFDPQDWDAARNAVVILSYSIFANKFAADRSIVGRAVRIDGRLYTVIGVMKPKFRFSLADKDADVWIPIPTLKDPQVWQFRMLARLRPGVDLASAQASISAIAKRVEASVHPYRGPNGEDGGYAAKVFSLRTAMLGDFKTGSLLLTGASGLLLLTACVNVTNLQLVRAVARRRETAIRRALGASGLRLLRQSIRESALLSAFGGALGLILSYWGVWLMKMVSPAELPGSTDISINSRVLLFAAATSFVVCLLPGLAPTTMNFRRNLSARGPRKEYMTKWLVTAEIAVAIVLLVGCGLLAKSFERLRQIDTGIRVEHLLTMRLQLSGARYRQPGQRTRFFSDLQDRLSHLPGVVSASEVGRLPVFKVGVDTTAGNPFSTDLHAFNDNSGTKQMAHTVTAAPGYFHVMGISLLEGRDFSQSDLANAPPVAIVNETLARRFYPQGNAVGRKILFGLPKEGAANPWMTIVGVISDIRTGALDLAPAPQFYMPESQQANDGLFAVLRTQGEPGAVTREALTIIRQLDPELPVSDIGTMQQHVNSMLGQPRFRAMLTALFAFLAVALAAIGIYGVVAHSVAQRTKEMGIRSALGANASRILATVLTDGMKPVLLGVVVGIGASAIVTRTLSGLLYQVKPDDAMTFAWAYLTIIVIGLSACLLPAVAASRVDPAITLREE
jgi:putative ABC transport system permease protein